MSAQQSLVGRTAVSVELVRALEDAATGRGALVLLAGDAGIGKTAVASHLAEHARDRGVAVAWGRCSGGPGLPALWPWTEVLRSLGTIDQRGGHLGDGLGSSAVADVGSDGRFRIYEAAMASLDAVADDRGLLVVLDDIHDADRDSLALLELVARQLAGRRLLVVGTYRDLEGGARLGDVVESAQVFTLRGLDLDETRELMEALSPVPCDDQAVAAMHERTGGNPLFVRELTRLLQDRSADHRVRGAVTLVGSVREVIDRRLARLSQATVALLRLAALDAGPLRPWLLQAVLGDEDIEQRIDEAVAARVLVPDGTGGVGFAHGLFREALVADLPVGLRRGMHRALADALQAGREAGAVVRTSEVATQLHAAALAGDEDAVEAAVEQLQAAADDATRRLAFDEAVTHLEGVLEVLGTGPQDAARRLSSQLAVADAHRAAGDAASAERAYRAVVVAARARSDAPHEALATLGLHAIGIKTGPSAERQERLSLLAAALASLDDDLPALRSRLMAAVARTLHHSLDSDAMAESIDVADLAVELAGQSEDQAALGSALLALHDVSWRPGGATRRLAILDELVTVAQAASLGELLSTAQLLQASARLERGDPAWQAEINRWCNERGRRNDPMSRWLTASRRFVPAALSGSVAEAGRLAALAAREAAILGDGDALWIVDIQRWELARFDGGRGGFERRRPHTEPQVEAWSPWRAVVLAEAGDVDGAAGAFAGFTVDHVWGPGASAGYDLWMPALAGEAAVLAGTDEQRADLYELLLPFAGSQIVCGAAVAYGGAVDHRLGRLAQALGRSGDDHLDRAVAQYRRLGAARWIEAIERDGRARAARAPTLRNRFQHDGPIWTLAFADRTVRLTDAKGLHDIAALLRRPGHEVRAHELAGIELPSRGMPTIDRQAASSYRDRLVELEDDIADADACHDEARAAVGRLERDALLDELRGAIGLGGRHRRLGDDAERARKTVTARIHRALRLIAADHEPLADHLRASLRTGSTCSYQPTEPTPWDL